ncbi:hypothetical protein BC834DRAFT_824517 [Gloeopeniophorella convolvens]|nr:hypothetical protein BC834DRAFT_824517 [Gloeopeniophorella convolvens]
MSLACFEVTPFRSNPLETKEDVRSFLTGLLDPLAPHTSPGGARIKLGHTGTHFDEVAAQLEGFARPLWGLAALLVGGGTYPGAERWSRGLASGTDPDGEEFWGNMRNKDQRMVECSPIGFSISVAGDTLWKPLNDKQKANFEKWLGGLNDKEMPNTNWLWFRVFANLGLSRVGSSRFDEKRMKADLDHLDTFYVGDGWSRDGPEGIVQLDYYSSSFAIQYAQLVYSKLARDIDPERSEEYRKRASKFAQDFVHYFDDEGRSIPFGRSMVYRFAMSSFWAAVAFADLELPAPLTWGVIKGILLRNLRYWAREPGAYNSDGTLTLGFCYPNHNLTENYNSPGSVYWCCKSFLVLALPETHPFWSAVEEPYPLDGLSKNPVVLSHPLHISVRTGGHTYVLSSGQQCSYPVKQSAAKYGKFGYSSAFGYSIPVGSLTLEELGGDSTLALSDDAGETWKARRVTLEARFETGENGQTWLRSAWEPWPDVRIETWLVPPDTTAPLWHLRIHRIRSARALLSAEGGWAIYGQGEDARALDPGAEDSEVFGTFESTGVARAASRAGVSGVAVLGAELERGGSRDGRALRTDANTNIVVPRAVLPTLMGTHAPAGQDQWLVTAVFGLPSRIGTIGAPSNWLEEWGKRPVLPQEISDLVK